MKMNIRKASMAAILATGYSFALNLPAAKAQKVTVQETLTIGDKVPDFSLEDQDGKTFKRSDMADNNRLMRARFVPRKPLLSETRMQSTKMSVR